jgi:hypothetical protein
VNSVLQSQNPDPFAVLLAVEFLETNVSKNNSDPELLLEVREKSKAIIRKISEDKELSANYCHQELWERLWRAYLGSTVFLPEAAVSAKLNQFPTSQIGICAAILQTSNTNHGTIPGMINKIEQLDRKANLTRRNNGSECHRLAQYSGTLYVGDRKEKEGQSKGAL